MTIQGRLLLLLGMCAFPTDASSISKRNVDSGSKPADKSVLAIPPDFTANHTYEAKTVMLEAFKVVNVTDKETLWVSVGYPEVVNNKGKTFSYSCEYISCRLSVLSHPQKETLANEARRKYKGVFIATSEIVPLPLSQVLCNISFEDTGSINGPEAFMHGSVKDLQANKLVVQFPYQEGSEKRVEFKRQIQAKKVLLLVCNFTGLGNIQRKFEYKLTVAELATSVDGTHSNDTKHCVPSTPDGPVLAPNCEKTSADIDVTIYATGNLNNSPTRLFISKDGGKTWVVKGATEGLEDVVYSAFGDGEKVYIGTSRGVGVSSDGGQTWSWKVAGAGPAPVPRGAPIGLYVKGNTVYLGFHPGGVALSHDGGATWLNKTTKDGLAFNTVKVIRVVGRRIYVATSAGVSVSENRGQTWVNVTSDPGPKNAYTTSMSVSGRKIVVGTDDETGLWFSEDQGGHWTQYLKGISVPAVVYSENKIYAGTRTLGLAISEDQGKNWRYLTTTNGLARNDINYLYIFDGVIYAGTVGGGLSISKDNGCTWVTRNTTHGLGLDYIRQVYVEETK